MKPNTTMLAYVLTGAHHVIGGGVNGTNPHREGGMFRGRTGWLCLRPNFVVQGAKNRGRCRHCEQDSGY